MEVQFFASLAITAAIGWVLYRFVRVNTPGIVLWCLAIIALGTTWWILPTGVAKVLGACCGVMLSMTSAVVFLVAAVKRRSRRAGNCACFDLAPFTFIAVVIVVGHQNRLSQYQETVRQTTGTLIKLHKLGAEIESLRARIGRLPNDEEELVALRGGPMPTFRGEYRISYLRVADDQYQLHCMLSSFWGHAWDLFGWIVSYHGPNSPQRIHVDPF